MKVGDIVILPRSTGFHRVEEVLPFDRIRVRRVATKGVLPRRERTSYQIPKDYVVLAIPALIALQSMLNQQQDVSV
jgi:hypothetical protein